MLSEDLVMVVDRGTHPYGRRTLAALQVEMSLTSGPIPKFADRWQQAVHVVWLEYVLEVTVQ